MSDTKFTKEETEAFIDALTTSLLTHANPGWMGPLATAINKFAAQLRSYPQEEEEEPDLSLDKSAFWLTRNEMKLVMLAMKASALNSHANATPSFDVASDIEELRSKIQAWLEAE